jgi:D-tagatose-bisphosphate aldolase class II non-catalytic subunit
VIGADLATLPERWRRNRTVGIASVCSAHPFVIEAALVREDEGVVLIEATCNQVNQEGGYTGMTPRHFRRFIEEIARVAGFDVSRLILGGDHLGPNPWKHLPVEEAMRRAEVMVADYVAAGFVKIHLDASMGCLGEPATLSDAIVAERAARLTAVAEAAAKRSGSEPPVYVIGTEVPVPGGATHAISTIDVTAPAAALATLDAHRRAFAAAGIEAAFARVVAVVVQPGVEFDHDRVIAYDPPKATPLRDILNTERGIVFEAHSTDYQSPPALASLVVDGFAILKVGPALTFAMREALYGLDRIALERDPNWAEHALEATMERVMLAEPKYWGGYYHGTPETQRLLRHYSYSDRVRYYWPAGEAKAAVSRLLATLDTEPIPATLVSQFLPHAYPAVRDRAIPARSRPLILETIRRALQPYRAATSAAGTTIPHGDRRAK